jgi:hypothetical protein
MKTDNNFSLINNTLTNINKKLSTMSCILPSFAYIFASSNEYSLNLIKQNKIPDKMRTLKNLSLTFLAIVLTSFLSSAVIFTEEGYHKNNSSVKPSPEKSNRKFFHTALYKGRMIPSVDLPVVTIAADRSSKNIVEVTRRGNSLIAVVNLPEIVIPGERKTSDHKLKTIAGKNGVIPVVDLTEVVIVADRINASDSFTWMEANDRGIPVVNLPEVIISADFPEYNKIATVLYKGHFIPVVNLHEVEITAEKPVSLVALNDVNSSGENNDALQVYLPSVEAKTEKNITSVLLILAKAIFLK